MKILDHMDTRIQHILKNFDFEKVHRYMVFTQWGWGVNHIVPTTQELERFASRLLTDALEDPRTSTSISSGGFHAHKWPWGELELVFVLEEESG